MSTKLPTPHDVALTRATLATLPRAKRCTPDCPGWVISESEASYTGQRAGLHVETCDECASARHRGSASLAIGDVDVRALPEARTALRAEYRRRAKERDVERREARTYVFADGWCA